MIRGGGGGGQGRERGYVLLEIHASVLGLVISVRQGYIQLGRSTGRTEDRGWGVGRGRTTDRAGTTRPC